ncbi:hypothetical protein [Thermicanus aegyptius]
MLSENAALHDAMADRDGLIGPNKIVVNMSTISPDETL